MYVKMKKASLVSITLIALATMTVLPLVSFTQAVEGDLWAVIICGDSPTPPTFSWDTNYMYHVLSEHYAFNDDSIYYLHPDISTPGVDNLTGHENVNWAIDTWLSSRSDSDDLIFIFFSDHGGGYSDDLGAIRGGRIDESGDEGDEVWNATEGKWVGFDECLYLWNAQTHVYQRYWDDELAANLNTLQYKTLIFACLACYSGGLIDDIGAPNRVIMTAANETHGAKSLGSPDNFCPWSEAFIDALHREDAYWDPEHGLVHKGVPINADSNNDGKISMWEAWDYAWQNDIARLEGKETPWLDDNGNGLPTYVEDHDELEKYDGLLSMETYFGFENLKSPDVNEDRIVDIVDVVIVANAFGSRPGDPNWDELADLNNDDIIDIVDVVIVAINFGKYY